MEASVEIVKHAIIQYVILANSSRIKFHLSFKLDRETKAAEFLAHGCNLSKSKIKNLLQKGGVWLKRPGRKETRLRKATFILRPGDSIDCYYDEAVLAQEPPHPSLVAETRHFSVWNKPPFLLSQGTRYGDHCSLLRFVEKYYNGKKTIHLIHRLDREAAGLVILAHGRNSASALSRLFKAGQVEKRYIAEITGKICEVNTTILLDEPLEGKKALTEIKTLSHDTQTNTSRLKILLHTGRYHQIRKHLAKRGAPLCNDRRYGKGDTLATSPLKLVAYKLAFTCPFTRKKQSWSIEAF